MLPKEKAVELVDKFYDKIEYSNRIWYVLFRWFNR
jgi:hypothetical protein